MKMLSQVLFWFGLVSIPLSWIELFGRQAPTTVEIGTGKGKFLNELALARPDQNILGVERSAKYHRLCCHRAERRGLTNVRLLRTTGEDLLMRLLPRHSVTTLFVLFPDPWPKKRHHKRRILQPALLAQLARVIRPGGLFHAATDWQDYAEQMLQTLGEASDLFDNNAGRDRYTPRPDERPLTKFEQRGKKLGHSVWDLVFRRL